LKTTGKQRGGVTGRGFMPGQSGNPGGRPRSERKLLERMFGDSGEKLYRELEALLGNPKTPMKLRADIAMFLIERLHGKPPQSVEVDAGSDLVSLILTAAGIAETERA
jgi:hypothetical protein